MGVVCGTNKSKKKQTKDTIKDTTKEKSNSVKFENNPDALVNEIQKNKSFIKLKSLDKFIFFKNVNELEEFFIISNFQNLKCYSTMKRHYKNLE